MERRAGGVLTARADLMSHVTPAGEGCSRGRQTPQNWCLVPEKGLQLLAGLLLLEARAVGSEPSEEGGFSPQRHWGYTRRGPCGVTHPVNSQGCDRCPRGTSLFCQVCPRRQWGAAGAPTFFFFYLPTIFILVIFKGRFAVLGNKLVFTGHKSTGWWNSQHPHSCDLITGWHGGVESRPH